MGNGAAYCNMNCYTDEQRKQLQEGRENQIITETEEVRENQLRRSSRNYHNGQLDRIDSRFEHSGFQSLSRRDSEGGIRRHLIQNNRDIRGPIYEQFAEHADEPIRVARPTHQAIPDQQLNIANQGQSNQNMFGQPNNPVQEQLGQILNFQQNSGSSNENPNREAQYESQNQLFKRSANNLQQYRFQQARQGNPQHRDSPSIVNPPNDFENSPRSQQLGFYGNSQNLQGPNQRPQNSRLLANAQEEVKGQESNRRQQQRNPVSSLRQEEQVIINRRSGEREEARRQSLVQRQRQQQEALRHFAEHDDEEERKSREPQLNAEEQKQLEAFQQRLRVLDQQQSQEQEQSEVEEQKNQDQRSQPSSSSSSEQEGSLSSQDENDQNNEPAQDESKPSDPSDEEQKEAESPRQNDFPPASSNVNQQPALQIIINQEQQENQINGQDRFVMSGDPRKYSGRRAFNNIVVEDNPQNANSVDQNNNEPQIEEADSNLANSLDARREIICNQSERERLEIIALSQGNSSQRIQDSHRDQNRESLNNVPEPIEEQKECQIITEEAKNEDSSQGINSSGSERSVDAPIGRNFNHLVHPKPKEISIKHSEIAERSEISSKQSDCLSGISGNRVPDISMNMHEGSQSKDYQISMSLKTIQEQLNESSNQKKSVSSKQLDGAQYQLRDADLSESKDSSGLSQNQSEFSLNKVMPGMQKSKSNRNSQVISSNKIVIENQGGKEQSNIFGFSDEQEDLMHQSARFEDINDPESIHQSHQKYLQGRLGQCPEGQNSGKSSQRFSDSNFFSGSSGSRGNSGDSKYSYSSGEIAQAFMDSREVDAMQEERKEGEISNGNQFDAIIENESVVSGASSLQQYEDAQMRQNSKASLVNKSSSPLPNRAGFDGISSRMFRQSNEDKDYRGKILQNHQPDQGISEASVEESLSSSLLEGRERVLSSDAPVSNVISEQEEEKYDQIAKKSKQKLHEGINRLGEVQKQESSKSSFTSSSSQNDSQASFQPMKLLVLGPERQFGNNQQPNTHQPNSPQQLSEQKKQNLLSAKPRVENDTDEHPQNKKSRCANKRKPFLSQFNQNCGVSELSSSSEHDIQSKGNFRPFQEEREGENPGSRQINEVIVEDLDPSPSVEKEEKKQGELGNYNSPDRLNESAQNPKLVGLINDRDGRRDSDKLFDSEGVIFDDDENLSNRSGEDQNPSMDNIDSITPAEGSIISQIGQDKFKNIMEVFEAIMHDKSKEILSDQQSLDLPKEEKEKLPLTTHQKYLLSIESQTDLKTFPSIRSIINLIFLDQQDKYLYKDQMGLRAHMLKRKLAKLKFVEKDMEIITSSMRLAAIKTKIIKLNLLKVFINAFSNMRCVLIAPVERDNQSETVSLEGSQYSVNFFKYKRLYKKLDKMDGLGYLFKRFFELVKKDELLMKYYGALPEYDLGVLKTKYAYFFGNQLGGTFEWNGTDIQQIHKRIGKSKKNCPFAFVKLERDKVKQASQLSQGIVEIDPNGKFSPTSPSDFQLRSSRSADIVQEKLIIGDEAVQKWKKLFGMAALKLNLKPSLREELINFMESMMQLILGGQGMPVIGGNDCLDTIFNTLKSHTFAYFYEQLESYIKRDMGRLQKQAGNDNLIKRIQLYIDSPTKKASLMIRVAAVISSHALEDFHFDDNYIGAMPFYAELDQEGVLKVPTQFQKEEYVEVERSQIFDAYAEPLKEKAMKNEMDDEVIFIQNTKIKEESLALLDPALQTISFCVEELFDEYDIEYQSSECGTKVFQVLVGKNICHLLKEKGDDEIDVELLPRKFIMAKK